MADFVDKQVSDIDPKTNMPVKKRTPVPIMDPTESPKQYQQSRQIEGIDYSAIEDMPAGANPMQYAGQHQSNWAQLGGFLNQAVVGQIIGGTMQGIGNLLDFEQTANIINGTEKEFSNWFSDLGKGAQTWSENATPIYGDYEEGSFSPSHLSWWMKNGVSVASTLSLMIPAAGAVKGVSMLGKALGISSKLNGQVAALRAAGKIEESLKLARTIEQGKWMTTGIGQAIASRHMENILEASQTHESIYKEAVDKGVSDEEAKQAAAKGAYATYTADWAMLMQDIPQYLILGKAFGKASVENTVRTAQALGKDITPILAKKGVALAGDMLGEGGEETFQYIVQKESEYLGKKSIGLADDQDAGERINGYLKSGDMWTSFVMGALGSGVFQTAGKVINNAINKSRGIESEEVRRVKDITSWAPQINYWHDQLREAQEYGDVHAEVRAENELWSTLAAKAAYNGNVDNIKEFLAKASGTTEEQATEMGFNPEAAKSFKESYPKAIKKLDEAAKLYNGFVKDYSSAQAAELTRAQLSLKDLDELSKKTAHDYSIAESGIVNLNQVSAPGQQVLLNTLKVNSTNKVIGQLQNWIDTRTITDDQKTAIKERITVLKAEVKKIEADTENVRKTKTKEQIKTDQSVKVDQVSLDQAYKLAGKKQFIDEAISSTIDHINKIKGVKPTKTEEDVLRNEDAAKTQTKETEQEVVQPTVSEFESPFISDEESEAKGNTVHSSPEKEQRAQSTPDSLLKKPNDRVEAEYKGETGYLYKSEGKIRFKSAKQDIPVADSGSKLSLKELGVTATNGTVLNMEVNYNGTGITANGKKLTFVIPSNPLSAINEDVDGNPVSVTLRDETGQPHNYKDKLLVTELAFAIAAQEAGRQAVLDMLVDHGATFVYIADKLDPDTYHKVYFEGSKYKAVLTGDPSTTVGDALDTFFTELESIMQGVVAYKEANPKATETDIKNEARRLLKTIKSPEAREVNTEKSAREISLSTRESGRTEEVQETASKESTEISEAEILQESRVPETSADVAPSTRLSDYTNEVLSVEETVDKERDPKDTEYIRQAKNPQFNVSYVYYDKALGVYKTDNQEFENFVADKANSLTEATFEFSFDYDYAPFWSKQAKNLIDTVKKGITSKEDVDSILALKEDNYENFVDEVPIKITITVGSKTFTGGLHYHNPFFGKSEGERLAIRNYRIQLVRELVQGNKVATKGAEKYAGSINNSGGNKKLSQVKGVDVNSLVLGVANLEGNIMSGDGTLLLGQGSPGNVFMETTATSNGSKRLVKLNVSKVSNEHANMLWDAFNVAAKNGLNAVYSNPRVTPGVKAKTVINALVYSGKDTLDYRDKTVYPDLYLADKTLYLDNNKVLHYGKATSINLESATPKDKADFLSWVTANKNYIVYRNQLGKSNKKDIMIGSFAYKAGEPYNKFLVDNAIIMTDLDSNKPFQRPAIKMNMNGLTIVSETKEQTTSKSTSDVIFDDKGDILYSNKPITVSSKSNKLWLLPAGTRIPLTAEEYLEVGFNGVNKVLIVNSTDPDIAAYKNTALTQANQAKINNLLEDLSFLRLQAIVKPIPANYGKTTEPVKPKVESTESLADDYVPNKVDDVMPEDTWGDVLFGNNIDNKFLKEATTGTYKKADIDKELRWLKSKLGTVPTHLSSRLLYVGSKGKTAFGVFTRDSITLYKGAEEGTTYHEAFHRVSLLYLTDAERTAIYREAKRKYSLQGISNEAIEERLAEEFRGYVIDKLASAKTSITGKIAEYFKSLFDFVYSFFINKPLGTLDIDKLFRNIERGRYRNSEVLKANYNQLGGSSYLLEVKGQTVNSFNNLYELNLMTKTLMFLALKNGNVSSVDDLSNLDLNSLRQSIEGRKAYYSRLLEVYPEKQDKLNNLISMWSEVDEKFDFFKANIKDHLAALNVKDVYDPEDATEDKIDNGNEEHDKSAFEYDSKDNAAASIKLLVSTLPSEEGVDPVLDLPIFTEFGVAWSTLMRDLSGKDTYTDMTQIIEKKAATSKLYRGLQARLNEADENTKTQFFVTFAKHKHKFYNVTYQLVDNKPSFSITSADLAKITSAYVSEWGVAFINTDLFDNAITPNKEKIRAILTDYKSLTSNMKLELDRTGNIQDVEGTKSKIVDFVKQVGIPFDMEQLNYVLDSYNEPIHTALYKFAALATESHPSLVGIFGEKKLLSNILTGVNRIAKDGTVLPYQKYLSDERVVRKLAEVHSRLFPSRLEDSVLGAGGNQYYVYSLNNYLTDFARQLSNNTKDSTGLTLLEKLKTVKYTANSVWLKELEISANSRNRFGIHTFSGLIKLRSGDTGKDYAQMTEEEKYLLNLAFVNEGYYPLPTVADKKSYFVITGPSIMKAEFSVNETGGLVFPQDVLETFFGYFTDEYNRIRRTKAELQRYTETGNKEDLIRYYHKNKSVADGNALKFLLFSEGKLLEDGNVQFTFADGSTMNVDPKSFVSTKKAIIRILTERLSDELTRAEQYGLINLANTKGFRKPTTNKMLDPKVIDKYKESVKTESNAITQVMFKYMINQMVATIETYKLLAGDPAFYKGKGKVDSLFTELGKRLPELTSTGDRLRLDFPAEHEFANKSSYSVTSINDSVFASEFYSTLHGYHFKLYNDFFNELKDKEGNPMYNAVQAEAMAKQKADTKLKNYLEVNQTDAQVYISPSFYRELRIRLGEWSDKHQAAYELLMSDEPISATQEAQILDLVMQPLKMLHYGMSFKDGLGIPVYDKMSMATLFPRTIKAMNPTADLSKLFDRMEQEGNKIDMVKFESAVKVGNITNQSFYTDTERTQTLDFTKEDLQVSHQELINLRRQLNTDPHDTVRRNAGTQFRKISLSNVRKDNKYTLPSGEVTGEELLDTWKDTSAEISNRGKDKILKKLGYTEKGRVDNAAFIDILRDAAVKSNMHEDLIQSLKLDEQGKPFMQIDAMMDRDWIYSRIISTMSKNIVDVNLPGNAFIQLTNFGLKSAEKSELLFQDSKGRIETVVSINLFKHIIPEYKTKTFEEKRAWLLSQGDLPILGYRIPTQSAASIVPLIVKDVLPESVGDTIILPAEFVTLTGSDFDIDKLFAVRYNYKVTGNKAKKIEFLDANTSTLEGLRKFYNAKYKGVIDVLDRMNTYISREVEKLDELENDPKVQEFLNILRVEVPKELTDTDIEAILAENNISYQAFKKLKEKVAKLPTFEQFVEENRDKSKYELNSTEALENRLIDTYFAVLTNPEHKAETTTPLDAATALIDEAISFIKDNTVTPELRSLGSTTPSYQTDVWSRNMAGKAGIAPFALSNTHHVLSQISNLRMSKYLGFGNSVNILTSEGTDEKKVTDLAAIYGTDNELISDWLAAFINIHVDNAKDPKAYYMNVNQFTWSMTNLLVRVGAGAEARYFLPQPILVEAAKGSQLAPKKGVAKAVTGERNYKANIRKKYKELAGKAEYETYSPSEIMNQDFLKKQLTAARTPEWYNIQLQIFNLFSNLTSAADSLNEFVQLSQIDTKNFGNNLIQLRQFKRKVEEFFKSAYLMYDNATDMYDKTFLRSNYDNMILKTLAVFSDQTITNTPVFNELTDQLLRIAGSDSYKKEDAIKTVSKALHSKIASEFFYSPAGFDMNKEKFDRLFYGENSVVQMLSKIKSATLWPELKNNALIKILSPTFDSDNLNSLQLITVSNNSVSDRWAKQDVIFAWEELLTHKSESVRKFAKALVAYSFYTSGFNKRVNSFYSFIPLKYMKDIGYSDFFANKMAEYTSIFSAGDYNDIIKDVLLNSYRDDELVPTVSLESMSSENMYKKHNVPYPSVFSLEAYQDKAINSDEVLMGYNSDKQPVFKPVVKMENSVTKDVTLFEYVGYTQDQRGDFGVYIPIAKKGYFKPGYVITEFSPEGTNISTNNLTERVDKNKLSVFNETNEDGTPKYKAFAAFAGFTPVDDIIVTSEYAPIVKEEQVVEENTDTTSNPSEYTNHSGGAIGSDHEWDVIGREFGITNHMHYYHENKTPEGNAEITEEQFVEGKQMVLKANRILNRKPDKYLNLLARNWMQVKNADAVFAVGKFTNDTHGIVDGGTGWAVQMAVDNYKPVYVFDQEEKQWYLSSRGGDFTPVNTPTLTANYAGIGTRQITEAGKQAIRDVYTNTFTAKEADISVRQWVESLSQEDITTIQNKAGISIEELLADSTNTKEFLEHLLTC